jgi:hypothetical protein
MTQIFHIAPATNRWGGGAAGLTVVMLVLLVVLGIAGGLVYASFRGSKSSTFEVSSAGLRLRGDVYGRLIPSNELLVHDARRVDVSDGPYRPVMRIGGTAVPGYRAGWFNLRNGRRALLYVTDENKVVLVPTTAGYDVLLSVDEVDAFLEALRHS